MKIGILAVQGDFEAHAAMLARLGAETTEVRAPAQLEGCDGLILPGGESTTQLQFLQEEGLADAIGKFAKQGGPIFGTCAGAILLATEVENPRQDSLKLLDMTVLRNGYGRQIASDVVTGPTKLKSEPLEMVSISTGLPPLPSRMIEPLPKARSIWESAASSAFDLSITPPSTTRNALAMFPSL